MAVTPTTLRTLFPEFSNLTKFPDALVAAWIPHAQQLVGEDRWGDSYELGVCLVVAHNVALGAVNAALSAAGQAPGGSVGVVSNRSVDKASVGYDVNLAKEEGAGFWNRTTYGQQYFRLVRIFGAGPVQAGTPGHNPLGETSGAAWPGPIFPSM